MLVRKYESKFIVTCGAVILAPLVLLAFMPKTVVLALMFVVSIPATLVLIIDLIADDIKSNKESKIREQKVNIMLESIERNAKVRNEYLVEMGVYSVTIK